MAKTNRIGERLYEFDKAGALGVVTDTLFKNCFWPRSASPFNPFAQGSSGIEVEGPPTPRNIIFPDDTRFLNGTRGDCFFQETVVVKDVTRAVVLTKIKPVDGVDREITYKKDVTVQEPVKEIVEVPKPAVTETPMEARRGNAIR